MTDVSHVLSIPEDEHYDGTLYTDVFINDETDMMTIGQKGEGNVYLKMSTFIQIVKELKEMGRIV